jgi:glycosyltransferase involved in cell wall biosynthesis
MPRVLYLCHGHPAIVAGGTETVAYDLFRAVRDVPGCESMFVGCVSPLHRQSRRGTRFQAIGRSSDEMVLWVGSFDRFMLAQTEIRPFAAALRELLTSFRPEIVHFHHLSRIGLEAVLLIRRLLPKARLVLTLHDYDAICANDGLMTCTGSGRLCGEATPAACNACFPEIPQGRFLARKLHISNILNQFDLFIAPSAFLRDRYLAWGLPEAKIRVVANGIPWASPASAAQRPRTNFGFFGNLAPHKGVLVALAAMQELAREKVQATLRLHGGFNFQPEAFRQAFFDALQAAAPAATHEGPYHREELARLMSGVDWVVVPSVWWENAPLVILEAMQHRRPVICSDIGGMAEMVEHGVSGLHFRTGDARDLARVMHRAATQPGLWRRLANALPEPPRLAAVVDHHLAIYYSLLRNEEALSA